MTVVTACTAFRYDLPLALPLRLGLNTLTTRQGFIISLCCGDSQPGYGEVAPLPGFHQETLAEALRQFEYVQPRLIGGELPDGLPALQGGFEQWLGPYALSPALRHGLETAVLNCLARTRGSSFAGLLSTDYRKSIPINGLLLGEGDDLSGQARALVAQGYQAIKLKVGRRSLQEDIATVRTVRQALDDTVTLRLDANRSWALETALEFGRAVADCALEYIEEPLANPGLNEVFYATTGIPVALDESLSGSHPESVESIESMKIPVGVAALVLKPAVIGGFERTMRFIRAARRGGLKTVISSVFEAGVGLSALANFAAAVSTTDDPMGLDTYRWLREDLPEIRFAAPGARVDVNQVHAQSQRLRFDVLTQVA